MVNVFMKEIKNTVAIPASGSWCVTSSGLKLSEGMPAQFVPVLAVSVLNKSTSEIRVFANESTDVGFEVPANSSRTVSGVPIWNLNVVELDGVEIAIGDVGLTLINDLEQTSRYNAYSKGRGF